MALYKAEDKAKIKRELEKQAITLAMESKWEEAAGVNKSILELFPQEVEAYNRLGKALAEVARYSEARAAFTKALELNPSNTIARKNLSRLANVKDERGPKQQAAEHKAAPGLFIEETGKTGQARLIDMAPRNVLAKIAAGDAVELRVDKNNLIVETPNKQYIGTVDRRVGLRLTKLIQGGNRYAGAIASIDDREIRIIIKETYQHPSLAGKVSFPSRGEDDFRPYVRDTILRYENEEEEEEAKEEFEAEWEQEESELEGEESPMAKGSKEETGEEGEEEV
jgi:tetratricopeptide (TPR) repeat protein